MRMKPSWLANIVLAVLAALGVAPLPAQVPSADQLEMLRSLDPADREALMKQLGISDSSLGAAGATAKDKKNEGTDSTANRRGDEKLQEELDRYDKRLKPEDSVLVDVHFIKPEPARLETRGEGLPPLTIPGAPAPAIEPEDKLKLEHLIDLVRSRNPYQLDREGNIELPGYRPIPLAGLTEEQATRRLAAEPSLLNLEVKVTRLPLTRQGLAALKPFGYDLFDQPPSTFAPVTDVPVPSDYVVGPGDQFSVQLYGSQNRNFKLIVGRDGRVNFPELGPISVAGQPFSTVRSSLESRVARQMIGVRASVSMGETRSIRVFVLGEAKHPGSYTVSGLSGVTAALFASGGVKPIGSLRDIQLKRNGQLVRRIDLYDLLLRGDTSSDTKLLPGDVIFVPPVGATVTVQGEVRRPGIYELNGTTSVTDTVALAGGLTPEADGSRLALVRVDEQRRRVVVGVPLTDAQAATAPMRNGDLLRVLRLRPTLDSGVSVEGHVFRPGVVAWRDGLRISEVLPSIDELRPNADPGYVLIQREQPPDRRIEVLSADLNAALRAPGSKADVLLAPRDRLIVFDAESGRQEVLAPLMAQLKRQSSAEQPSSIVSIAGRVKAAGDYPLQPGMRVSDLLRAGGGLQDAAYAGHAELTRYRISEKGRETQMVDVDLAAILTGDAAADLQLQAFDYLNVKELPEWSEKEQITLVGEVRFPGIYPIRRGETLKSVLDRAGGLTALAFPEGSVFTRKELKEREQQQIDRLAERLQGDLATAALQGTQTSQNQAGQALTIGQSLLNQLKSSKPVGRLVIDLQAVLRSGTGGSGDVVLRDGDELVIPKMRQEVTVLGEVQNSTSHLYRAGLSRDNYVSLSGGLTRKADRSRIYVVRADGSVVAGESRGWFRRGAQVAIKPGDTIVAPLDTERMPALPLWQAVTQIIYNLSIAAAAVHSF